MTTVAHRSALRRPSSGGIAARRPLIRWAWRLFRREWRQQILVIALLTVAVAAAISSVTIAYNSASADDAEFGSANHLLELDGADPRALEAGLAALADTVRDDRRHRPPLPGRSRRRRQGGVPFSGPARSLRGRAPLTPPRQLPGRPQPGRRHRRCRTDPRARAREDSCPRRPSPDGCRHRREPT